MAQNFPWRSNGAFKRRKLNLPRAHDIPRTTAYEKILELLGVSVDAWKVLKQVENGELSIELRDGSTIMARKDGSLVLLEDSNGK